MHFEWFISSRSFNKHLGTSHTPYKLMRIAIFGIALCVAVMIISIAILVGFKKTIRDKVIGFGSHIQIVNLDTNTSYETVPIDKDPEIVKTIQSIEDVKHVQTFAIKAGIIKTNDDIQGIVLKGIDKDFDWSFFKSCLVEGNFFEISDTATSSQVLISQYLSKLLKLRTGDEFVTYFVQDPPRARKFIVSGIYNTDVSEIDRTYVLCDMAHIQKLNNWTKNQVSGYEITLRDFNHIDELHSHISEEVSYITLSRNYLLKVQSIKELYPQIFDWLNLMDMNAIVIIILMLAVSGFNMIAGLIILILDRTHMIGILKALGANNQSIRNIFLIKSLKLIAIGLFYGNLFGLGLCFIQKYFKILTLNPASYYISYVPIDITFSYILILNIGVILITMLMLLIPSHIISRLNPAETIKFA